VGNYQVFQQACEIRQGWHNSKKARFILAQIRAYSVKLISWNNHKKNGSVRISYAQAIFAFAKNSFISLPDPLSKDPRLLYKIQYFVQMSSLQPSNLSRIRPWNNKKTVFQAKSTVFFTFFGFY
jgi:hypothetical protein